MARVFADVHAEAAHRGGALAGLRALAAELPPLLELAAEQRRAEREARAPHPDVDPGDRRIFRALREDLRYGVRSLRASPAFTLVAVLTLALGIGASTTVFTAVDAVLLRPLEYARPEGLVVVRTDHGSTTAAGTFLDWKRAARSVERMAAAEWWSPSLTGEERPEQLTAIHVSADLLPMYGVKPLLGRGFLPEEEHAGRDHAVVLSHDFWRARYDGDRGVIGRTLTLNGEKYTIIGVMPAGFRFAPFWNTRAALAAPLVLDARTADHDGASLRVFARLRPGVTLAQARADLAAVGAAVDREFPGTSRDILPVRLHEVVVGDVRPALLVLLAAVGFVLLMVCANVAHLQLVRGATRERDFALRAALGASRRRLVQQTLVESGLLSLAGGAAGLLLALGGVKALVALAPRGLPRVDTIAVDPRVVLFAAALTLVVALVAGLAPAVAGSRVDMLASLKDGARGAADGVRRLRVRGALVVSEFAVAIVLLAGAGLVIRSFAALLAVDPGFDARNVVSMVVSVRGTRDADAARRAVFFEQLVERARALPGVEGASAINHLPLHGDMWQFPYAVEGRPEASPGDRPTRGIFRVVRPGYFRVMHQPIVAGREFGADDGVATSRTVVINESMARRQWPGRSALGQRITVDEAGAARQWFTVVGVVHDARQGDWSDATRDEMFFPHLPVPSEDGLPGQGVSYLNPLSMTVVVRGAPGGGWEGPGGGTALAAAVERAARALDPDAPVSDVITMTQAVAEQFAAPKFYVVLLGAFAGVALVLAAVGVYGVISYSVARRTREIGIRLALGAMRADPFRLVVGNGMRLAAAGGAIGLAGALGVTRYLRTLLYGVGPTDPATFALVTVVLGAVALAACAIPAWRAARTDPVVALRSQ
jgi:putative ABC transport system permease protein